jgi:hypothetical protein
VALGMRVVGITLMALAIINFANVSTALEARLSLRYVYLSCVSWSLVWLSGFIVVVMSAGNGRPRE